jgi:hypothetical protein
MKDQDDLYLEKERLMTSLLASCELREEKYNMFDCSIKIPSFYLNIKGIINMKEKNHKSKGPFRSKKSAHDYHMLII